MKINKLKQNIKIAEFCGWRFQERLFFAHSKDFPTWYRGSGVYTPSNYLACFYDSRGNDYQNLDWQTCFSRNIIPDYAGDLNAMHKAEALLNVEQTEKMDKILRKIGGIASIYPWRASAEQRAGAFLKAIRQRK